MHADNINKPEENKISFNNINITLNGKKSNGLKSKEKSIINVSGLATIKSNKDDSAAISSERKESRIFINKVDIEISGDDSNAIVGTKNYNQKAEYNIKIHNGKIISTGNNSNIIHGHGTNIFIENSKLSAKNGNLISLDGSSYINISKSTINAKNAVVDIMGENEGNISNVILNNVKQENTNQDINLINAKGNSELQLTLTNGTQVSGGALKENTATTNITMNNNSQWNLTKVSNISNLNSDNSQLNFAPPTAKNFLTLDIDKNLTSKNGKFVMNTTLNNDLSPTDKLIIKGNTSGTAGIIINNINGKGESTVNGIELIQVNGNSSGEFKLANRAVAYDYTLQRGGHTKATSNKNWYLTNVLIKTREKSPHQFNPTENEIESTTPIYRPEFGSYIKNIQAANTLFHMTLHDRLGETRYKDALTMEHKVTSMWIRGVIGRNRARMGDDQLRSQANRSVIQIGGDLAQWSANECKRYHLGGMVGYANHRSNTVSNITGSGSIGRTVGYSAGLYGTWYSHQLDQTGLYLDSWTLYNWFDNETHGDFQHNEKYKSRGATISAESGYTFKIY